MTDKIIHLSDMHIGRENYELSRAQHILEGVGEYFRGVPVLITGDLTDSATPDQMRTARKLLDGLALTNPILCVPGNHDYDWKGNILRPGAESDWVNLLGSPLGWGAEQGPKWMTSAGSAARIEGLGVWEIDNIVYFGVDSGDPKDSAVSARGYVSKELALALGEQLDRFLGKTRIVFLHHHPFDENWFTALVGADDLLGAVQGRCEALLFGHEHRLGIWRQQRRIPFIYASHKTTDPLFGDRFAISVVGINGKGPEASFWHRLELI